MSIVIVPCWRRPAHLAATLRTIERARSADMHEYVLAVDRDPDPAVFDVIDTFQLRHKTISRAQHDYHGPAFNILATYAMFLEGLGPDDYIGMIEEDILVAEDIFEFWLDALRADPIAACVSACANQNLLADPFNIWLAPDTTNDERAMLRRRMPHVIYRHTSYQSLAVALRKELLEEVSGHATATYFHDPTAYCAKHLPDSGLQPWEASQDGLFHRVIRRRHHWCLYPVQPRAFHAGWYGYNRRDGEGLESSNWRVDSERILEMSSDDMNAMADPRFRDIERCDLTRPRTPLVLI